MHISSSGSVADAAVDANGHLWVVTFGGSMVLELDPE